MNPDNATGSVDATPTDLTSYLDAVRAFLCDYVVWPSEHEPIAVVLWVAHAHLIERFDMSPILAVTSAEMRSGKTRLLDCLEVLCPHPERMVTPSAAVAYTLMAERPRPTILLDEADAIFGGARQPEAAEGLRAALNSGNRRGTPVPRVRMDGHQRVVERLDVYGAKAIAGIGRLPDTVTDRSIVIRLRRKAAGERASRFRSRRAKEEAASIMVPDWDGVPLVPDVPDVPEGLNDRAAESWEPLLAIADAAGGEWAAMARTAAEAISGYDGSVVTEGVRLLTDIRQVFGDRKFLHSGLLLTRLTTIEGSPWSERYGRPLTARGLSVLLEPYGIRPRQHRVDGEKARGYFREDFEDAWRRYCP